MSQQPRIALIRNVIHDLRTLVPRHGLDHSEALTVAEVQAVRLLILCGVAHPPVPVVEIARQAGVVVEHEPAAGVVGAARLGDDGLWRIGFADTKPTHRDATVAHQFKRILDHQFEGMLYPPVDVMATAIRQHHVAEHFAACLTLPEEWIERQWRLGERDVTKLAERFRTTPEAMLFRLKVLRLVEPDGSVPPTAPAA